MTERTHATRLALGDKALDLVEHLFGRRRVPVHDVIPPGLGSADQGLGSTSAIVAHVDAMRVRPIQCRFNNTIGTHSPWLVITVRAEVARRRTETAPALPRRRIVHARFGAKQWWAIGVSIP